MIIINCSTLTSNSFLICEKCDKVTEIKDDKISAYFSKISSKYNLEVYGLCKDCKNKN